MNEFNPESLETTSGDNANDSIHEGAEPAKRQSRLGIASFIIGLASIVGFIVSILFFSVSIMNHIGDDGKLVNDPEMYARELGLLIPLLAMFGSVALSFVGLILGIVGACMKRTRKAFSVIGIVLNGLLAVLFAGLFIFGLIIGASRGSL